VSLAHYRGRRTRVLEQSPSIGTILAETFRATALHSRIAPIPSRCSGTRAQLKTALYASRNEEAVFPAGEVALE